ncbi:OmpA family protein [Pedobacter panaciterrae]
MLYFTQEGNVIKANAHLQGYFRAREVVIKNSVITIDYNGDGKSMYTFTLEKDAEGKLKLKSYDFRYNGAANQMAYAIMAKKSEAFSFANLSFKAGNTIFSFTSNGGTEIINWPGDPGPYYKLTNIGFKTNNDKFLGVTVPNWNGVNVPAMLLEKDDVLFVAKEYDGEVPQPVCNLILPGVSFKSQSTKLATSEEAILSSVAQTLRGSPSCKVVVTGYCSSTLADRQLSWRRVESVIQYLTEKQNIDGSRFIFKYGQPGNDCNVVDLKNAAGGQSGGGVIPSFPSQ